MARKPPSQEQMQRLKHLELLQAILKSQDNPEWQTFKAFLQTQALTQQQLAGYYRSHYSHNETASETALRNELFRAFTDGLLYSTRIIQDAIASVEREIESNE